MPLTRNEIIAIGSLAIATSYVVAGGVQGCRTNDKLDLLRNQVRKIAESGVCQVKQTPYSVNEERVYRLDCGGKLDEVVAARNNFLDKTPTFALGLKFKIEQTPEGNLEAHAPRGLIFTYNPFASIPTLNYHCNN